MARNKVTPFRTKVNMYAFSSTEIEVLSKRNFRSKRLREMRDILLLSYYTGLSFTAIKKIRYSSLILGDEGDIWIKIGMTSRGGYEVILLIKKARDILGSYTPPFRPDNDLPLMPQYLAKVIKRDIK